MGPDRTSSKKESKQEYGILKIKIKNGEASGPCGWIRLVKLVWTACGVSHQTPSGPETGQKGPKSPKTDQNPGNPPRAPIG